MQQHNLTQGSAEWHAHRARFFNASDAAAMLGISPYKTRAALLQERATGIAMEITTQQQRVFNRGHELEALARPIAEDIVGEELFPVVGSSGNLSASFDGITMLGDTVFEHKTLNQSLRYDWDSGNGWHLPEHYQAQMEQQLMVSGAERVLFMASEQDDAGNLAYKYCWYASNPAMRQRIESGWAQFESDLQEWQPAEQATPVHATPVESLPAVVVQVQGALSVDGNLPAFGQALRGFIERIPARPGTDQEFADCDAACKSLKRAEEALEQAERNALAQISGVELMRRTVADLRNLARTTRLATEKLVKAEKDGRRSERVMRAHKAFADHVQALQSRVSGVVLRVTSPDFALAIKGLHSLASIDEKLTAAVLEGKANAEAALARVQENLALIDAHPDMAHLFADRQELSGKDPEFVALTVQQRLRDAAERETAKQVEQVQAVQAEAGPATPEPQASAQETIKLGDINKRLHPLSITESGLRELGFTPAGSERRAVLYHSSQWPSICAAIARHVQAQANRPA